MNKNRKLIVALAILITPLTQVNADTLGPLTFTNSGTEITIDDCDTSTTGTLVIPDTIQGQPVVRIGDQAFRDCSGITEITLPSSLISTGESAFLNCTEITEITFPDGFTTLGTGSFNNCFSLATVNLPDSTTSLGTGTFFRCALETFTVPANVTSLGNTVFNQCSALTTVTLNDNLGSVSSSTFASCVSLTEIIASPDSINFSTPDGVLYNKTGDTLVNHPIGKTESSFTIPANVTTIASGAFAGSALSEIILPDGLVTINSAAFNQASNLTTVTIPATVETIRISAFTGSGVSEVIFLGEAPSTVDDRAFGTPVSGSPAIVLPEFASSFGGEGATFKNLVVTIADPILANQTITITSITTANAISSIAFTAKPSTTYLVKSSTTLQGFAPVTTTPATITTDASGNASFDVDASAPKNFFIVEEEIN